MALPNADEKTIDTTLKQEISGQNHVSRGEPVILADEVVYVNLINSCAGIFLEGERDAGLHLEIPTRSPAGWESFWKAVAYEARRKAALPPPTAPKTEACICWKSATEPCRFATRFVSTCFAQTAADVLTPSATW
ncbi:hypothetical protein CSOJ01_11120 [Colletotrichum sojae]|uniref:Uncharacterized protein n=1 Tax=Colletotrichum sojae TaxID=2175907 RepID=A0A8H6MNA7_9PEZI|nr:hypothetical protein CSOJ01_11120 [Colletotrichum sojae]